VSGWASTSPIACGGIGILFYFIYPSVLIRGASCCDSCWCRSICISGGTPFASISCNHASETGRLEDWQVSALIRWCSGAVTAIAVDPFPISVERWSPSNKYQLQPNIQDRYLHCQVYFWNFILFCCDRQLLWQGSKPLQVV
jgi:hypothetical protein